MCYNCYHKETGVDTMNLEYRPITEEYLTNIMNVLTNSVTKENLCSWVRFWQPILNDYVNDNAPYFNKRNDIENFPLQYKLFNMQFSILFNIDQILTDIKNNKLQIKELSYEEAKDKIEYTESDDLPVKLKEDPPILVFLPSFNNKFYFAIDGNHRLTKFNKDKIEYTESDDLPVKLKEDPPILVFLPSFNNKFYFAIDGNHRLTKFNANKIPFKSFLINQMDLHMKYFLNINSWLCYHFQKLFNQSNGFTYEIFLKYKFMVVLSSTC